MLDTIKEIAREAGAEILRHYGGALAVETKADQSPLTLADRAAHSRICAALREFEPGVPVLSEESDESEIRDRRNWRRFWLVDPLDGTKEFLKQTGEFTVNIARIEDGVPVLGVIHVPVREWTYSADRDKGAWKETDDGGPVRLSVRPAPRNGAGEADGSSLCIVASRDHAGPLVKRLLEAFPSAKARSMGSSLKFCLVAEGEADLYLRDAPTMEWDVGAAQCIVEAAGGRVLTLRERPLRYNKEDLRNPALLTSGDATLAARVLHSLFDNSNGESGS